MNRFLPLLTLVSVLLGGPVAEGKYARVDVEKVPIEKLVANLEKKLQEAKGRNSEGAKRELTPQQLHYSLARLHSMAYAQQPKVFDVQVITGLPFFGYGTVGRLPPSTVTNALNPKAKSDSQTHLKKAIEHYRRSAELDARHTASHMGLGWCLEQSEDKPAAIVAYRKALELAWKGESKSKSVFEITMTEEVARYLLPLLDSRKDKDEIEKIKKYQAAAAKFGRMVTPILVPLEPDTSLTELVNADARVTFDLDGSGLPRQWGWITPKAAWLVYDHDGKGQITSGLQMFGSVTFWIFWRNGYAALSALDENGDGELRGDELRGLALWHDVNGNGIAEPGEVKPLSAYGIVAVSCRSETHTSGIPFSSRGVTFQDGTMRPSYDWIVRSPAK